MPPVAGSIWIEGTFAAGRLRYIDECGNNRALNGSAAAVGSSGILGSIWVESTALHWLVDSGVDREDHSLVGTFVAAQASAVNGSIWVEQDLLHYIDASSDERTLAGIAGSQFQRPDADINTSGWATVPLWSKLDEITPDDATTEITSTIAIGGSADFEVSITTLPAPGTDPCTGADHKVRVRVKSEQCVNCIMTWTAELKEGAAVRASFSVTDSGAYLTTTYTLTTAEADAITDYNNLSVRVNAALNAGASEPADAACTWIEMEIPG